MKIRSTTDGNGKVRFNLSDSYPFDSIVQLIEFYRTNNLRESFAG